MAEEPNGVSSPLNVLYIYEERIPENSRQLIRSSIPPGDFVVDETTYAAPATEASEKMRRADTALPALGRVLAEPILGAAAARLRLIQFLSSEHDKLNTADAGRYGIQEGLQRLLTTCTQTAASLVVQEPVSQFRLDSSLRTLLG